MARRPKKAEPPVKSEGKVKETSHNDRAPYQKNSDRDPVKSAEETRDIPTKHGAIK
jgi:hypothetical protein